MPLKIIRQDIIKMKVDAIVNSAHPMVSIGYGVDSRIHDSAGPILF
jgi:O-acetyl-ADP-ribose deacetylase (regulator of RNase III)